MDSRSVHVSGTLEKTLDPTEKDLLPIETEVPDRPYSIRDIDDKFSLIHCLSKKLKEAVLAIPDDYFYLNENEMRELCKPTSTDYALRVSFWREFEKMMWRSEAKIYSASIFAGICSDEYFYQKFIKRPDKLAWMIRPMQTYKKEMEAILYRCTERLWELVEMPIKDKKGTIDGRKAETLLKVITSVENRVKGMAVQRSENKSVSVHAVTATPTTNATKDLDSMASVEARIRQLQREIRTTGGILAESVVVEATTIEETAPEREIIQVGKANGSN